MDNVKYDHVRYVKLDCSEPEGSKVATSFGVRTIPLLMFLEYGKPMDALTGTKPKITYEFKVRKFAGVSK